MCNDEWIFTSCTWSDDGPLNSKNIFYLSRLLECEARLSSQFDVNSAILHQIGSPLFSPLADDLDPAIDADCLARLD